MTLQASNRWALKEWAVVCRAVETGRQSVLLRKGGIDEGPGGFCVQHPQFWLLPTRFHEGAESLSPGNESLMDRARANEPTPGTFRVSQYAVVEEVREVRDSSQLEGLAPLQILSIETLHKRFHYRRPGLWLLVLRSFIRDEAHVGNETPELAGCRSWAELPTELATGEMQSALSDEQFATLRETLDGVLR